MPSFDIGSAATTLTNTVSKTLSSTGLATGLSSVGSAISGALDKAKSAIPGALNSITGAIPGLSTAESALDNAKKNITNFGNLFENSTKNVTIEQLGIKPGERLPNPLHYYSSFNYIFTLSVLDDASLNFPNETYRKGVLGPIILKSGSGDPNDRVSLKYKPSYNPQGGYDFFMDDLEIKGAYGFEKASGNTNATGINFRVTEPYSMGLFFETLQTAALQAGHPNYTQVPLLLSIEFKGHLDANRQNVQIDNANVRIPLKIRDIKMKVTGKGSEYDISTFPYNESGYSTVYSRLKSDVAISGTTVIEMLQTGESSLQYNLNRWLAESVKRKDVNVPDQILISFPNDLKTGDAGSEPASNSATVSPNAVSNTGGDFYGKLGLTGSKDKINTTQVQVESTVNDIGKSGMGFSVFDGGEVPFAKDNFVWDNDKSVWVRGNMSINPKESVFQFAQGSDVTNAINQVILMSDYGRTALQQIKDGWVQWWRIEVHAYNIPTDENLKKTGLKPKLIVYRVVPYKVSSAQFTPPNTAIAGIKTMEKKILKEYEYIYTGNNRDIIDWNIEFKNSFYKTLSANPKGNEGVTNQKTNGGAAPEKDDGQPPPPTGSTPTNKEVPTAVIKDGLLTSTAYQGGGGLDDLASLAAKQFHDAVTQNTDMIGLDLTILGDPFYLGDSGMGNYSAKATDNQYINSDGKIDWQRGEVNVIVKFRSPVDINQTTGLYDLKTTTALNQFGGIYRIKDIISYFQKGKFTQVLKMYRLMGQNIEAPATPTVLATGSDSLAIPGVQVFDDGSTLQTFEDGSTLAVGTDGSVSSTTAELRTNEEVQASRDLAGFDG